MPPKIARGPPSIFSVISAESILGFVYFCLPLEENSVLSITWATAYPFFLFAGQEKSQPYLSQGFDI